MIKKITHPSAYELRQARIDESIVTGRPLIERPFYYENTETGQQYYDLYGCIGWPTEDTDKAKGLPGYVAVVAVVKSSRPPEKAWFRLMGEGESEHISGLFDHILRLREEFGFGQHPGLLQTFIGDPDRHIAPLALYNESLVLKYNHPEKGIILFTPPFDFYQSIGGSESPDAFDSFKRSLEIAIVSNPARFAFGGNSILKTKHHEYRRNNPAIFAIGGLVHTLLHTTPWMDQASENMFVVQEGV